MPSVLVQRRILRPFRPDQIGGLAMWLDAADPGTIILNGSTVSQWTDKSGFGRNVSQANATLQPAYTLNVQNGLPGILFDNSDDRLFGYSNDVNPCTWFVVHQFSGTVRDTRLVTNVGVNQVGLGISASSANTLSFVREGTAWTNSGFAPGTTTRLYRVSFNNPTSTYWTWANGVETQRQTLSLTGSIGGTTGFDIPGYMFERILYHRTLTSGEANQVFAYLSAKWAIT